VAAPGRTRERILDVALDHFAEHGFAGTSISAIERDVGLAAGTGSFHRHFPSVFALNASRPCRMFMPAMYVGFSAK
jgi:AcrR family transcriptional regulator